MKVLIATDTFKGSLTSYEAGVAISKGIKEVIPSADVTICEIADGGEGTFEVITKARGGIVNGLTVTGPLGEPHEAGYGIADDTAIIDISQACGLPLVPEDKRNPLYTTTEGIGDLINDALDKGIRRFIVGLGGSSTNDCGAGMLSRLGVKLTDRNGNAISRGASGLESLSSIDITGLDGRISESEFHIACDVTNPLTGENGCSKVFAPQKGADPDTCFKMDEWIRKFASLTDGNPDLPGSGAAGGLGFAFRTFLNGTIEPGAKLVIDQIGLKELIKGADIVITGEGCLDAQTAMGKGPSEVARLGKLEGAEVIAFAGCIKADEASLKVMGIDKAFSISDNVTSEVAMRDASALLTAKAGEVFTHYSNRI